MAIVRCPQCGTEFDREQAQFCPNPKCGYPVAFIEEPTPGPEEKVMVRRPGERVEPHAPAPEEYPTQVMPPPRLPTRPPMAPYPHIYGDEEPRPAPTDRRLRWWMLAAALGGLAAVAVALTIVVRDSPGPPATAVAPVAASVVVTTTEAPLGSQVRLSPSIDSVVFHPSADGDLVALFFVRNGMIEPVERRIEHSGAPAKRVMQELLAGPDEAEADDAFASDLPRDITVRHIKIEDEVAYLDLSPGLPATPDGIEWSNQVAQLVFTLTQFSTVRVVEFLIEGTPAPVLAPGDGRLSRVSRQDFR